MSRNIKYVAYIDEAGDFGLTNNPGQLSAPSEWFVLGAFVIRKTRVEEVQNQLQAIRYKAKNRQAPSLHFRTITDRQKLIVAQETAKVPARFFGYLTNKLNMRDHENERAAAIAPHRHWFYWWGVRLLLERVTEFCALKNKEESPNIGSLEIVFSKRDDFFYSEFTDYATRLWTQRSTSRLFLNKRQINWDVFTFDSVRFDDHHTAAGLQFADVVASALFKAATNHPMSRSNVQYARELLPKFYQTKSRKIYDEGLLVWPGDLRKVHLFKDQRDFLEEVGYPAHRLPTPIDM